VIADTRIDDMDCDSTGEAGSWSGMISGSRTDDDYPPEGCDGRAVPTKAILREVIAARLLSPV
jgi:hypothetical protein